MAKPGGRVAAVSRLQGLWPSNSREVEGASKWTYVRTYLPISYLHPLRAQSPRTSMGQGVYKQRDVMRYDTHMQRSSRAPWLTSMTPRSLGQSAQSLRGRADADDRQYDGLDRTNRRSPNWAGRKAAWATASRSLLVSHLSLIIPDRRRSPSRAKSRGVRCCSAPPSSPPPLVGGQGVGGPGVVVPSTDASDGQRRLLDAALVCDAMGGCRLKQSGRDSRSVAAGSDILVIWMRPPIPGTRAEPTRRQARDGFGRVLPLSATPTAR